MIRVIEKVITFPNINKKAEELARFCKHYEGCMFISDDDFIDFKQLVKTAVQLSNQRYPKSKPLVMDTTPYTDYIYVHIQDSDQDIVRIFFTRVVGVYHKQQNKPIESISYALKEKEENNG